MILLNVEKIKQELKDYSIGQNIEYFKTINSTNEYGKNRLESGNHQSAVIFAEKQTRGKGRMGRKWSSPYGKGLWMSVLFTFLKSGKNHFILNCISSLAVHLTLKNDLNLEPEIKWPNDILLNKKKVCGILLETVRMNEKVNHIVAGIGLNVNQKPHDFSKSTRKKAISLRMVTKKELDRTELAISIIRNINNLYLREKSIGTEHLFSLWINECSTVGQEVEIDMKNEKMKGVASSINPDGSLIIKTDNSQEKKVISGDLNYIIY